MKGYIIMQNKKNGAKFFSVALLITAFIYGLTLPFMWGNNPALPTGTLSLLCEDRKIYFWIWGILMSGSIVMSSQLVFKKYNVKNRLLDVLGALSFISILGVALTLGHSIEDWNPKRLIHWIMTGVFIAFTFLSIALFYIMHIKKRKDFILPLVMLVLILLTFVVIFVFVGKSALMEMIPLALLQVFLLWQLLKKTDPVNP